MTLFVASIALIVLLIASYGTRRIWLGCLSVALTAAALAGIVFLAMLVSPGQGRAGLAWLASTLPLDREAAQSLASAIENAAIVPPKMKLAAKKPASPVRRSEPRSEPQQAAAAPSPFGPKTPPRTDPNSPVAWFIDDPDAPVTSPLEEGLSIGGVNVSDRDLRQVEGTLKPDGSWREIPLTLKVEGRAASPAAVIPAGGRFSLVADSADAVRVPARGAILTFRYVYEGQRKAAILYLNAATLSRFASRE
jgi:hypothetical protein